MRVHRERARSRPTPGGRGTRRRRIDHAGARDPGPGAAPAPGSADLRRPCWCRPIGGGPRRRRRGPGRLDVPHRRRREERRERGDAPRARIAGRRLHVGERRGRHDGIRRTTRTTRGRAGHCDVRRERRGPGLARAPRAAAPHVHLRLASGCTPCSPVAASAGCGGLGEKPSGAGGPPAQVTTSRPAR